MYLNLFKPSLICLVVTSVLSTAVFANEANETANTKSEQKEKTLKQTSLLDEQLTIFGHSVAVNNIPGSAHRLGKEELEKFDYSDIMRTLTSIPGVYVLEEDGYGLRPNIGMRGTGQNRSEKVTIMEDGVLAAPAPYAAPSAYYFPTAGRMEQIEVLKGTSSAMYGPRTTGGVLNMLSRRIPQEDLAGLVNVQAGQDGFAKIHAVVGGKGENLSSVFEVYRYQADGFKDINNSSQDTGFVKNDVLAKVRYNTDQEATFYQEIELKVKYSDEDSNDTYMGLTEQDFASSPDSRYSASQKDNMSTDHLQLQLNHVIDLSSRFSLGTSIYRNEFSRNWYKTSKVNGKSLGSGGIEIAAAHDAMATETITVDVKANNRDYLSQGIQSVLDADFNDHQVKFGIRLHQDEMDRYQWVDKYDLDSSYTMTLTQAGQPGSDSNRIDSAKALALFVHDEWTAGDFIVNAGLRYEDMKIERNDWGKNDAQRVNPAKYKVNKLDVFLPSLAVSYQLNDYLVLLGGVQKGFAPPSPGNDKAVNEESINYELGARFSKQAFNIEGLFFLSDYENMHGNCTASQNCDDDNIGEQYNAGEVKVLGMEFTTGYAFELGDISMPIDLTYTWTQTEFLTSFDSDFWGEVNAGDQFPYVPENQLQFVVGLEGQAWRSNVLVRYTSSMRTEAGVGSSDSDIDARTVVDFVASYDIANRQQVTFNIDNLFDETYMASRTHGSIMVGKPLTVILGYKYSF